MNNKSNRTIVLEFFQYIIGQHDTSLIDNYVSDGYVQHSPTIKDGKAGLREAIEYLRHLPKPEEKKSPIIRIMEDGHYVLAHLDLVLMGQRKVVVDLFRLEHGKLAEHWDVIQNYPPQISDETSTNDNAIEDITLTERNKSFANEIFQGIANSKKCDILQQYLAPNYTEHNPEVDQMTGRLGQYLCDLPNQSRTKVHRIIGEGNFVAIQSSGQKDHSPYVFFDILRFKDQLIVEHWSVEQIIPDTMAHTNGMI